MLRGGSGHVAWYWDNGGEVVVTTDVGGGVDVIVNCGMGKRINKGLFWGVGGWGEDTLGF